MNKTRTIRINSGLFHSSEYGVPKIHDLESITVLTFFFIQAKSRNLTDMDNFFLLPHRTVRIY